MYYAIIAVSSVLWIWFLGCTITWRFGRLLLVEGMGIKSIEFAVLVLFTLGCALYIGFPGAGKWVLLFELAVWLIAQFCSHWYYTIFGVTQEKLAGYNQCFEGTARIFPLSEARLIPDLYHIVLHILIALDLVLVILYIT
ncbi:MAG: hypothetical protein IKT52_06740 [Oscillospiraceae bacterium]|nr:hypothetical protein [Oscillospiraceae bacterium]